MQLLPRKRLGNTGKPSVHRRSTAVQRALHSGGEGPNSFNGGNTCLSARNMTCKRDHCHWESGARLKRRECGSGGHSRSAGRSIIGGLLRFPNQAFKALILSLPESCVSVSIPSSSPKTFSNCEGSEIIPYLQAGKLACCRFMDAGRRHKVP